MSHSVKVTLIADQEITVVGGENINIYDIRSVVVDSNGIITEVIKHSPNIVSPEPSTNKQSTPLTGYECGIECPCSCHSR